uniref:Uncharacterized protein n=1 Tax=Strombidium rassoulzadegani TaxID=1082188 RepID=A0A7S3CLH0_9SPIT|mmetsp:Transcript_16104/g.27212  ORF Transcript_16104/g.27212 Transcript_16104/m.27212 type:complete len:129 (+) Transcript_16104:485-871(+)
MVRGAENNHFMPEEVRCVIPGVLYWGPMRGIAKCEVGDCENKAYQQCNDYSRFLCYILWEGCEKKVCFDHYKFSVGEGGRSRERMYLRNFYCFECEEGFKKGQKRKGMLVTLPFVLFLLYLFFFEILG